MSFKINKTVSDSFLQELESSLNKTAVQPSRVDNSLFHQINNIMNSGVKSKFNSVSEVVEDMKVRSGLTAYLSKLSEKDKEEKELNKISTASDDNFIECLNKIKDTISNVITSTKGGLPVHAILDKIKSIHFEDCDSNFWEDARLVDYVAKANLQEKSKYPTSLNNKNIGKVMPINESNQWDNDYFYGINA